MRATTTTRTNTNARKSRPPLRRRNPEDYLPKSYFEVRCSNDKVASCAYDTLTTVAESIPVVINSQSGIYNVNINTDSNVVSGCLPPGTVNVGILESMLTSGYVCNSDWATLVTQDPQNSLEAWSLANENTDPKFLERIALQLPATDN